MWPAIDAVGCVPSMDIKMGERKRWTARMGNRRAMKGDARTDCVCYAIARHCLDSDMPFAAIQRHPRPWPMWG
ncbi:hypothetical protein GW17_00045901 [Ensete ventricosum]|nr:hypothetical protein GW17_00045901 [Ensete ventricosum]